jgi:hypothetical protein
MPKFLEMAYAQKQTKTANLEQGIISAIAKATPQKNSNRC